ncbi:MAG: transglutaminase-like cysteine peptidase [Hyphomicrobiales bacterium]|nr:transglutaminase-like cysteine peptidase [Hyphomicrobiales bacterium]
MRRFIGTIIASMISVAAFSMMTAPQAGAAMMQTSATQVGPQTSVPYGWVDFCQRYHNQCPDNMLPARDIALNARSFAEISDVNHMVNQAIQPTTDEDHWHKIDQWDLPMDGRGDCEDYALLKRKLLIERGFPRQALLITVVRDEHNEGHAILTMVTDHGDFVLDNLRDSIKPWSQTGYRFIKRQSQQNPNIWVRIDGAANVAVVASNN